MTQHDRAGLYFDGLGGIFIDVDEAEGKQGQLVRLSPAEAVILRDRVAEALLEAASRVLARRRRRRPSR